MDRLMDQASPERIAQAALHSHCQSVAFTYNDPVIFAEYALDTADACHAVGVQTVAVTAGYIHAAPRAVFFDKMDAANVDLKAFTDAFLLPADRRAPRARARHPAAHPTPHGLLAGDHHPAHPRPQRQHARAAGHDALDRRAPGPRCAAALHGLSPRLQAHRPGPHARRHAHGARAASPWMPGCGMCTPATCTTWTAAPPTARNARPRSSSATGTPSCATSSPTKAPAPTAAARSPAASARAATCLPAACDGGEFRCGWRRVEPRMGYPSRPCTAPSSPPPSSTRCCAPARWPFCA